MARTRLLGVVVPVGSLRGSEPAAVGEFPDLIELALLCKKMKVGLIQLLPVNDTGFESSPYSSLTAFALHPLYLRIGDLPEAEKFKPEIDALNREFAVYARFPYQQIMRAKMDLLWDIYAANKFSIAEKAQPGGSLDVWIGKNQWVKEYAIYRRLKKANAEKSWKEWTEYRTVTAEDIDRLWNTPEYCEEHLFWVWLQEAADRQFSEAAAAIADADIMLEGDIPILMNDDSCDVWAHPEIFIHNFSAGAPPDMYSPDGQNWGFPLYNWEAQEKDDFAWWKRRLAVAEKYFQAYRIDHVLGFFRIWASSLNDYSAALGRYVPYTPFTKSDLRKLGFDKSRIRWVSKPHIPTGELMNALHENWASVQANTRKDSASGAGVEAAAKKIFSKALERIGDEELWLFKKKIKGEKHIDALGLHPAARPYLLRAWQNRLFCEYEKGKYYPSWHYRSSRAYQSLSAEEKEKLESLLTKRMAKSQKVWEIQGKKLLSMLVDSSKMLPCAEDLGEVPPCVPRVLTKLSILGLCVVRWECTGEADYMGYIPFEEYPELSVCTPGVHDTSTVREWWEREANQKLFSGFLGFPSLPKVYNPGTAKIILSKAASARSCFRVIQIQDLLHLSNKWYAEDPASERINVPGTNNQFNWTYRMPAAINEIGMDKDFVKTVTEISKIKAAKKNREEQEQNNS